MFSLEKILKWCCVSVSVFAFLVVIPAGNLLLARIATTLPVSDVATPLPVWCYL
jgi:hypothetical protein